MDRDGDVAQQVLPRVRAAGSGHRGRRGGGWRDRSVWVSPGTLRQRFGSQSTVLAHTSAAASCAKRFAYVRGLLRRRNSSDRTWRVPRPTGMPASCRPCKATCQLPWRLPSGPSPYFDTDSDARSRAMLRGVLAEFQLRLDPPDLDAAEYNVHKALEVGSWSDTSSTSRARLNVTLGKVLMRRGLMGQAREIANETLAAMEQVAPLVAADALHSPWPHRACGGLEGRGNGTFPRSDSSTQLVWGGSLRG